MKHRCLFDALDRTQRDVMETDKVFGGKVLLLAGDFRQILPVVRLGRRADVVDAALSTVEVSSVATVCRAAAAP